MCIEVTSRGTQLYVNGNILYPVDRHWLTEGQKIKNLQEKVYLALQHSLHKSGASDEKLDKVKTSSHNSF